jgi:hypothetical protein
MRALNSLGDFKMKYSLPGIVLCFIASSGFAAESLRIQVTPHAPDLGQPFLVTAPADSDAAAKYEWKIYKDGTALQKDKDYLENRHVITILSADAGDYQFALTFTKNNKIQMAVRDFNLRKVSKPVGSGTQEALTHAEAISVLDVLAIVKLVDDVLVGEQDAAQRSNVVAGFTSLINRVINQVHEDSDVFDIIGSTFDELNRVLSQKVPNDDRANPLWMRFLRDLQQEIEDQLDPNENLTKDQITTLLANLRDALQTIDPNAPGSEEDGSPAPASNPLDDLTADDLAVILQTIQNSRTTTTVVPVRRSRSCLGILFGH